MQNQNNRQGNNNNEIDKPSNGLMEEFGQRITNVDDEFLT
jgi:hypothetical protein